MEQRNDYISWDEYFMGIALLSRFLDLLCDHLSLVDLQIMKLRLILVKTCTCQ